MTSEQLRNQIDREVRRSHENLILATNPKSASLLMQQAAVKEYNACARRLADAAAAMCAKMDEQLAWCDANPNHPKFRSIEDEFLKNLARYRTCDDHARGILENPLPIPARQAAMAV